MKLIDVFEKRTTLPLTKQGIRQARAAYDALVVVMHPLDFIRLTTVDEDQVQEILDTVDRSIEQYSSGEFDDDFTIGMHNMPFLKVRWPSGQVAGHEGRHRAALVYKVGGKSFPCTIAIEDDLRFFVTWKLSDGEGDYVMDEHGDDKIFSQEVASIEEAKALQKQYRDETLKPDYDWDQPYKGAVKVEVTGGNRLRGHPDRNDFKVHPRVYGKWTTEDMPSFLIGQYNPSFRLPRSKMKIGVVKPRK